MKTKKTIRKLKSGIARDMARTSRDLRILQRRIDRLTDDVETLDFERRVLEKANEKLVGKLAAMSLPDPKPLFEETPEETPEDELDDNISKD